MGLNRIALTGAAGTFAFSGLPAGHYHVSVALVGYAPGHVDVDLPAQGTDPIKVTIRLRASVLQLNTIEVTATPLNADPRSVTQATVDVSAQVLAREIRPTVALTLQNQPGVATRFNGPAASAPVIRGLQGERILVLQDGDRAGDLSSSAPDHSVSIDPLIAQRIEVVRGPASLLYGNQALGGVVNVISNDLLSSIPAHLQGEVAGQAESAVPGGALAGSVTVPLSRSFALVARGGGRTSGDYREGGGDKLENTFFHSYNAVGGFGFATKAATGGLVYRGYHQNYGLPSSTGERSRIAGQRNEIAGRSDFTLPVSFMHTLRVSGTAQWYNHSEINEENGNVNTAFKLRTQTLDLLGHTKVGELTGAVGVSGLFKQYAATGEEALTPAANSTGIGVLLYQEIPLANLHQDPDALVPKLQLGGRFDRYQIDSKAGAAKFGAPRSLRFNNASGSLGITVPFTHALNLGVSVAQAFRAPSVEELFSNAFHGALGTYDVGNPDLKSEINRGVEAVFRVEGHRIGAQFAGYYNRIKNFISPNIVGDTTIDVDGAPTAVPLNRISQADATLRGLEGQIELEVASHVVLGGLGDVVRGNLRQTKAPLPFLPAARLGTSGRYDNGKLNFGVEFRHAFRQDRVPVAVTPEDPSGVVAPASDLVNLSAGFVFHAGSVLYSLTLRADNLLDEKYVDATSRLKSFAFNPGRNLSLVSRINF